MGAVAPEHGFLGLVDEAFVDAGGEDADDVGLVLAVEREVRVPPVAEDAEPPEAVALNVNELAGKSFGAGADFGRAEAGRLADHLEFDRQAVTIPSWDVRGFEAGHGLRFQDQVFEDFVQGGAHVHVAIGEGRAVVEDVARGGLVFAARLDGFVESRFLPFFEAHGFALHQIGAHGKICLRQEDGILVGFGGVAAGRGLAHEKLAGGGVMAAVVNRIADYAVGPGGQGDWAGGGAKLLA